MGSAARSSNSDGGTPLRFQRPSQALGRRHAQLEGVERLGKAPAVLGHRQPIQQGPLQVRDGHAGFADPHLLFAEEAAGFDLNEPVRRVADGEAAPSLAREFTRLEEAVVHGLQVKDLLTPYFLGSACAGPSTSSDCPAPSKVCVVNQQKWDTLRPEKVIVMRSVGRAP